MAFSPIKEAAARAATKATLKGFDFSVISDSVLGDFAGFRSELERKVKLGDLTVKVARDEASREAARLKADLSRRVRQQTEMVGFFHDRVVESLDARRRSRDGMSLEGLQRETNKMLRQLVIEQQLQNRRAEFEARTFQRSVTGGVPAPTLDGLLRFHEAATLAGDEAAREWSRRHLEEFRVKTLNSDDQALIDAACDRPDTVNPRVTSRYVDAMKGQDTENLERFVREAVSAKDANACAAAFLLAKGEEQGTRVRWVRLVLESLPEFPEAALLALRAHEAEIKTAETESARRQAEIVASRLDREAKLADVEAPTREKLERLARMESRAAAMPGESIGLALSRRGLMDGEQPETPVSD